MPSRVGYILKNVTIVFYVKLNNTEEQTLGDSKHKTLTLPSQTRSDTVGPKVLKLASQSLQFGSPYLLKSYEAAHTKETD